ncbi:MAG TPA: hypothetical protein VJ483_03820 [Holophagaceae bacterium]|nr:hypothetical protein [Holophagaceae bacterium]
MIDGQIPAPAPSKGMNPALKWVLIGCGTLMFLMMLAMASCVWFLKKKVVDPTRAELQKQGIDTTHGITGAMTGVAGAAMGMAAGAAGAQAIPSLPPEERKEAQEVFRTLAEKGSRMDQRDIEAYSAALKRFQDATEPMRKAKHEAMWNETDPAKKSKLAQEAILVDPKDARQLVADLKVIADRIK